MGERLDHGCFGGHAHWRRAGVRSNPSAITMINGIHMIDYKLIFDDIFMLRF